MKRYHDIFELTKTVVNLYLKLAELEKAKKQRSKEYKEMMDLLRYALIREKEKERGIDKQVGRVYYQNMVYRQSNNNYFVPIEPETLAAIRFANYLDDKYLYTLDGVVLKEDYQVLQSNLDVSFYNSICYYLHHGKQSKEERETLIDFRYGLLATSTPIEDNIFTEECFLPFNNRNMSHEELEMSSVYIYQKVEELMNYLMGLSDCEITNETLPMILYIKSCLPMLQPVLIGCILTKLKTSLGLNKLYGCVTGESRNKMCSKLSYLLETELQKSKK